MDRCYSLYCPSGGGSTAAFGEAQLHDELHKRVDIPIYYSGSTGVITEVQSNNLGVLLISKGGHAVFESKMRIRFDDEA